MEPETLLEQMQRLTPEEFAVWIRRLANEEIDNRFIRGDEYLVSDREHKIISAGTIMNRMWALEAKVHPIVEGPGLWKIMKWVIRKWLNL